MQLHWEEERERATHQIKKLSIDLERSRRREKEMQRELDERAKLVDNLKGEIESIRKGYDYLPEREGRLKCEIPSVSRSVGKQKGVFPIGNVNFPRNAHFSSFPSPKESLSKCDYKLLCSDVRFLYFASNETFKSFSEKIREEFGNDKVAQFEVDGSALSITNDSDVIQFITMSSAMVSDGIPTLTILNSNHPSFSSPSSLSLSYKFSSSLHFSSTHSLSSSTSFASSISSSSTSSPFSDSSSSSLTVINDSSAFHSQKSPDFILPSPSPSPSSPSLTLSPSPPSSPSPSSRFHSAASRFPKPQFSSESFAAMTNSILEGNTCSSTLRTVTEDFMQTNTSIPSFSTMSFAPNPTKISPLSSSVPLSIRVKCVDENSFLTIDPENETITSFNKKLYDIFGASKQAVFQDCEGDILSIQNTNDIRHVMGLLSSHHTFRLNVFDKRIPLRVFNINASGFGPACQLGSGGDGAVYKASLTLAVKQLQNGRVLLNDRKYGSVQSELDIPFRCDHPNILNVYGYGLAHDNHLYMLLVLKDFPLNKLIIPEVRGTFQFKEHHYLHVCLQILHGLRYLHRMGIGHADMKLENILVEESNGFLHVVLADFGRSKDFSNSLRTLAVALETVTTILYSAPEVFDRNRYLSSDMYSFALMAWELFVGRRVALGKEMQIIMANVVYRHDVTFSKLLDYLPPLHPMRDFLPQCWAKEPSARLTAQRAIEFLELLSPHFGDLSPLVSPLSLAPLLKPITSFIRSLDDDPLIVAVNIDPL
jgi:hypothetical protein